MKEFDYDGCMAEMDIRERRIVDEYEEKYGVDTGGPVWGKYRKKIDNARVEIFHKYLDEAGIGHTSQMAHRLFKECSVIS